MFLPTAALTLIIMLFVLNKEDKVIQYVGLGITMAQLLSYGAVLYLTEKDLKKEFDDRGKRRNNI